MANRHDPIDNPDDLEFTEHAEAAKRLSNLREQMVQSLRSKIPESDPAVENPSSPAARSTTRTRRRDELNDTASDRGAAVNEDDQGGKRLKIQLKDVEGIPMYTSSSKSQLPTPPSATGDVSQLGHQQKPMPLPTSIVSVTSLNTQDPMIYPGIYAPSGIDMLSILIRVYQRPSPKYDLGFIDSSCALTLCSTEADMGIVYCSDAFLAMTGYPAREAMNCNCRFLQSPTGVVMPGKKRAAEVDEKDLWNMKQIVCTEEVQICLTNFRKGGEKFENLLTTIPIEWGDGRKYIVGFQADRGKTFT